MSPFSRVTAFLLLSGSCSLLGQVPILREGLVPSLTNIQGNIFYAQKSYNFDGNANLPISFIQILGARIRSLRDLSVTTNEKTVVRAISRSKYSIRARASFDWIAFGRMTINLVQAQSWYVNWWSGFENSYESCGVRLSTAGPFVDATTGTFSEGVEEIRKFFAGLKMVTISEAELATAKSNELSWVNTNSENITKEQLIEQIWQGGTSMPAKLEETQKVYNSPIPLFNLSTDTVGRFNMLSATQFIEEWHSCPIEILVVGNEEISTETFVSEAHRIVSVITPTFESQSHLPYTDFGFNLDDSQQELFEVPASLKYLPGLPVALINLGPLSAHTLITADMIDRVFSSVADGQNKFMTGWTIRSGCVLLVVKIDEENSSRLDIAETSLRSAVDNVRHYFEQIQMENDLGVGGSLEEARTVGPQLKAFTNADAFPENQHKFANAIIWMTEAFEGERAFEELANINTGIVDETTNMTTLVDNLRAILLARLRTDNPAVGQVYFIQGSKE